MKTLITFQPFLLLFFISIFPYLGLSQCPDDDVVFRDQADIDAFKAQYPNCNNLKENLFIVSSDDIVDLSGLNQIRTIRLQLFIRGNDALTSLAGLDSLSQIGAELIIENNPALQNLQGLGNLKSIGEDCKIESNPVLASLQGLDALEKIGGSLWLFWDDALTDLTGLGSLTQINESLLVNVNAKLKSLNGIGALDSLGGSLNLDSNPELIDFTGLESLRRIDEYLMVTENAKLLNMQGLNSLESIGQRLVLRNNPSAQNFEGLESLVSIGDGLLIWQNEQLKNCKGLDALETIYGYGLSISHSDELTSLDGLSSLRETHALQIQVCPKLNSLEGLAQLNRITFGLYIHACPSLTDLEGLEQLIRIDGFLSLSHNTNLENLEGLAFLSPRSLSLLGLTNNPKLNDITALERITTIDSIFIIANPQLAQCEIQAVCNLLTSNPDFLSISDNNTGCNSHAEIQIACDQKPAPEQFEYRLFPNPSRGTLRLEQNDELININQIELIDTRGSLVYRQKRAEFDYFDYFDLRHLNTGLYHVILYTEAGETHIEKVLFE